MASRPVKLKLLPRSTMKVKSLTRLVSRVLGTDGITVSFANNTYTIGLTSGFAVDFSDALPFTAGDIFYASGASNVDNLAAAATGNVLLSGVAPSWGKVGLTTHVSGTLPITSGGTGTTSALTTNGVVIGGPSALTATAAGALGAVLTGKGTLAAPVFLSGVMNVKAFGATGDGITDDTAAIQAAEDDSTNGTLYFPKGIYLINATGIVKKSGKLWIGDGPERTIIRMAIAPTNDMIRATGRTDFGFRGIRFDGGGLLTRVSYTTPGLSYSYVLPCIYASNAARFFVENCNFTGFHTCGLLLNSVQDFHITGCLFDRGSAWVGTTVADPAAPSYPTPVNVGNYGILIGEAAAPNDSCNGWIAGSIFKFCQISYSGHNIHVTDCDISGWGFSSGVNNQGAVTCHSNTIAFNTIHDSNQAQDIGGFYPAGTENWGADTSQIGNIIYGIYGGGIGNSGKRGTIIGNTIRNCGAGAPGTIAGIDLGYQDATFNSSDTIVIGNVSTDTRSGGSKTQGYGLSENNALITGVVIQGNIFTGNATAEMLLAGPMAQRVTSMAAVVSLQPTAGFVGGAFTALDTLTLNDTGSAFTLEFRSTSSPALTANRIITFDPDNADRAVHFGGDLTLASHFTTAGGGALTMNATLATSVSYPASGSITVVDTATAQTLTNKSMSGSANTFTNIPGTAIRMGSDAHGDLTYFDGANYSRLPAGTSGQFLKTQGAGANPIWSAVPATSYYLMAYRSATQSVTSGVKTKIQYDVEAAPGTDPNGWYDNATNYRFTPLVAGKYWVNVTLCAEGTTVSGIALAMIYKNGSELGEGFTIPSSVLGSATISMLVTMNGSTDYIEGWGRVTAASGAAFSGQNAPLLSFMSIMYAGP